MKFVDEYTVKERVQVPCTQIFKSQTFRDVNVRLPVQSHTLVHVSSIRCHVHASSTSGSAFVYFTILYRVQYFSSLFQAQDAWKQSIKAAVM